MPEKPSDRLTYVVCVVEITVSLKACDMQEKMQHLLYIYSWDMTARHCLKKNLYILFCTAYLLLMKKLHKHMHIHRNLF